MSQRLQQFAESAPVNRDHATVDWAGYAAGLAEVNVADEDIVAATWCVLSQSGLPALVNSAQLTTVFPRGVFASCGKRKLFGGSIKGDAIAFSQCRRFYPLEHQDERGFGKYAIEFTGSGGVFLGRLEWNWHAKRFRDSRAEIMAVADERDRILGVIQSIAQA